MSTPEWLVVFDQEGRVIAVGSGAPAVWVGERLEDDPCALPEPVREHGRALLAQHRAAPHPGVAGRARVSTPSAGMPGIDLVVVEAIGVQRARVDLVTLLFTALDVLRKQAHAMDVSLMIEANEMMPRQLSVDPEKIVWVVATLVGNALRYVKRGSRMMPGGTIRVSLSLDPERDEVVIQVSDDGAGIPPEKIPWLFTRQPGAPMSGGLALILARDVIAAHGGSLTVESANQEERGTTFTLRLPIRTPAGGREATP